LRCPECGAEFAKVGIRPGEVVVPFEKTDMMIVTLAMLVLAGPTAMSLTELLSPFFGVRYSSSASYSVPEEYGIQSVDIDGQAIARSNANPRPTEAFVTITKLVGPSAELRVDLVNDTRAPTTGQTVMRSFNTQNLREWIVTINPRLPAKSADQLSQAIYATATGPVAISPNGWPSRQASINQPMVFRGISSYGVNSEGDRQAFVIAAAFVASSWQFLLWMVRLRARRSQRNMALMP
jgi:hypothetical protein